MADNVNITEGSGKIVAADDVGSVFFQKIKLDLGTDGASAPALAGAGAVATGVQRITLASDDPAVALLGTIDTDTGAMVTDLAAIEVLLGTMDTDTGAIVTDLAAIEVLLGTIDADTGAIKTAVETLDNAISGTEMQVDIVAALPAGTNLIGKVGIDQTTPGTTNRVDIGALIPGTGATNLGKARNSVLGATDTGVMALAVRDDTLTTLTPADGDYVPLRVSSTGQLHVTGGGGGTEYTEDVATANPIVGTATMMERDDIIASLGPVEGDWAALRCSAEGALWTQDFNSDATLMLLGTIDADTGAIKTAIEKMDDWDATHDSAASSDGPQLMAAYDATKPAAVADGDAVRVLADEYGRLLSGVEKTAWQEDYDSSDASSEGEAIKASAASTILVVQSYVISVDAEMWVKLQEENSSALTGKFWLKAGGGVAITLPDKAPLVLGVDSDLEVITEGAGNISVSVTGYTIPG